jgi:hypothetical protein
MDKGKDEQKENERTWELETPITVAITAMA